MLKTILAFEVGAFLGGFLIGVLGSNALIDGMRGRISACIIAGVTAVLWPITLPGFAIDAWRIRRRNRSKPPGRRRRRGVM